MATHRAYLLDKFGGGDDSPENRQEAVAALAALWQRLLAERSDVYGLTHRRPALRGNQVASG
jgi:hypothetical protein